MSFWYESYSGWQTTGKKWELDETLISAINHHDDGTHDNILKDCVFSANQINKKMQFGFSGNIITRFGLSLDDLTLL